jgi:hypothetical protein
MVANDKQAMVQMKVGFLNRRGAFFFALYAIMQHKINHAAFETPCMTTQLSRPNKAPIKLMDSYRLARVIAMMR